MLLSRRERSLHIVTEGTKSKLSKPTTVRIDMLAIRESFRKRAGLLPDLSNPRRQARSAPKGRSIEIPAGHPTSDFPVANHYRGFDPTGEENIRMLM
jgi:hypothetical protein